MYKPFTKLYIGELFVNDLNVNETRTMRYSPRLEKMRYARDKKILLTQSGRTLECFGKTHAGFTYIDAFKERFR